jgi:hypothetical protein
MYITHNKGFIFYTDVMIATILLLFTLTFLIFFINNTTNTAINSTQNKYLESKTIFVADSFIKNFNPNNSLLGACTFNTDKKRILSNQLSLLNFVNIKPLNLDDFFIKEILIENILKTKIFYQEKDSNTCITIKRFVLVNGLKSKIYFTGCLI